MNKRAIVFAAFGIAGGVALCAASAFAEVGGTVTATPGARGPAYLLEAPAGSAQIDLSLDNDKGGQVPVTLTWCNPRSMRVESLTVPPGRTQGQSSVLGGWVAGPAPCGGVGAAIGWSCGTIAGAAACRFEWKVERHCNCGLPAVQPAELLKTPAHRPTE
jgi:hypothetical protein